MSRSQSAGRPAEAPSAAGRLRVVLPALVVGILLVAFGLKVLLARPSGPPPELASIGAAAAAAGCEPVVTRPANGNSDHRPVGQTIAYADSPPAFGPHWPTWLPMSRKLFTPQDRPALEYLVHNEEHGFTILWYDATVASDPTAMDQLRSIAAAFPSTTDLSQKFLVAPWLATDGSPFPDGTHVALTHWSMGGTHGNPAGQLGVWQYCSAVSGAEVAQFMTEYPYSDSPEPMAL